MRTLDAADVNGQNRMASTANYLDGLEGEDTGATSIAAFRPSKIGSIKKL